MRRATRACAIWLALTLTVGLFALLTATITLRVLIAVGIALGNEYGPIGNLWLTVSGLATNYAVAVGCTRSATSWAAVSSAGRRDSSASARSHGLAAVAVQTWMILKLAAAKSL